jgi:hypothetical protein
VTALRASERLAKARLAPRRRADGDDPAARNWNRIGGLLQAIERETGIPRAALLAVWMVECGGLPFTRGRPVLRFEPHVFFARWGEQNPQAFDRHFQYGGRNGIEGKRWEQHRFRESEREDWARFHGDQSKEYRALAVAAKLADEDTACLCASFGGPQIMGFNYAAAGYGSAAAMRRAFARSERWQVLAFLDFCAAKDIIGHLKARDWLSFASVYNGPGNSEAYAAKIAAAYDTARRLTGETQ